MGTLTLLYGQGGTWLGGVTWIYIPLSRAVPPLTGGGAVDRRLARYHAGEVSPRDTPACPLVNETTRRDLRGTEAVPATL